MVHVIFWTHLLITAFLFSKLEINSEGANGWAEKFPTWKLENKWTQLFWGSRPLTGYHLYFSFFMLSAVHMPYIFGIIDFSIMNELRISSYFVLFFIIEDFLWFVLNPSFGLKKFKPEYIWWHAPNWWWIMPRDYWIFLPLGIALYIISWII